jgi:predicted nuclease of predicted toxin-antitoxin system
MALAARQGFAIVSKDSDFHQRSFVRGHPPKVIGFVLATAQQARSSNS